MGKTKPKPRQKRERFERWSHENGTVLYNGVGMWGWQFDFMCRALNRRRIVLPAKGAGKTQ